jgi:MoaA/NifB/PqqE/SkfB family radical SAM enzyme
MLKKTLVTDAATILSRKRAANAYLPRLAEGYVRREIDIDDLCHYFEQVAHLYTVGIDVNAVCNLSCGYCYLSKYNRQTAPDYVDMGRVFSFAEDVIELGVDLIAIVGKEPFVDDRGIQLLQQLHKYREAGKSFRYGVVTNGTLLERRIDQLPQSISYVDVSLDGNRITTASMRGDGVYEKAAASLSMLIDRGYDAWVSSVLYMGASDPSATVEFMREIAEATGCGRFYFSPVRNFTGDLNTLLLSFSGIERMQAEIAERSANIRSIQKVILDHPYEAVWRDYFSPIIDGAPSQLGRLCIDTYGNILERLSEKCFRKLDVFPHGPWGTCRVDARGEFLPDVEARTFAQPYSVGNIREVPARELHRRALTRRLRSMLGSFLRNMTGSLTFLPDQAALTSVSMPV